MFWDLFTLTSKLYEHRLIWPALLFTVYFQDFCPQSTFGFSIYSDKVIFPALCIDLETVSFLMTKTIEKSFNLHPQNCGY